MAQAAISSMYPFPMGGVYNGRDHSANIIPHM